MLLLKCVHTTRDRVSILKRKKIRLAKLILMRMLNIKQDKVVTKDFCLQSLGQRTWINIASRTSWWCLKVREKPAEGYQSAIACHLAANEDCRKSFRESAFSILCRCRSKHHQDVLEARFIHVLRPKRCNQKSFVTNLVLFNVKHSHKN